MFSIPYDTGHPRTFPILALDHYVSVAKHVKSGITTGNLFPGMKPVATKSVFPVQNAHGLTVAQNTTILQARFVQAETPQDKTMHSFCSGRTVSRAFAEKDLPSIMQRAFWKEPKAA